MSDETETTIHPKLPITAWLALAATFASVCGSYALLRSEVSNNERRILLIEAKQDRDAEIRNVFQDTMSRIDERTKYIVGQVQEIKAQVDKGR